MGRKGTFHPLSNQEKKGLGGRQCLYLSGTQELHAAAEVHTCGKDLHGEDGHADAHGGGNEFGYDERRPG